MWKLYTCDARILLVQGQRVQTDQACLHCLSHIDLKNGEHPKFKDTQRSALITQNFKHKGLALRKCLGMAKSADPDQTAPLTDQTAPRGAV